jgi:hypothetical protein
MMPAGVDTAGLELNRHARRRLRCINELEVFIGATKLFVEPATLRAVARLASNWFAPHLDGTPAS